MELLCQKISKNPILFIKLKISILNGFEVAKLPLLKFYDTLNLSVIGPNNSFTSTPSTTDIAQIS